MQQANKRQIMFHAINVNIKTKNIDYIKKIQCIHKS